MIERESKRGIIQYSQFKFKKYDEALQSLRTNLRQLVHEIVLWRLQLSKELQIFRIGVTAWTHQTRRLQLIKSAFRTLSRM
ncbi:hypothetical protein FGO68_gene15566 [Halteria grandinella]|uniref:Uncharacterized protein n=1 Tax=Halteria grandinella TaxID=5974 RepID=A0A8J8NID5_HALGN|nr:hypothetical protein FGO68_gene15566 [Halteria grandinella]